MIFPESLNTWLWTVDPEDWRAETTAEEIVARAGEAGSGDVILLHDWVEQPWEPAARDRSGTVHALPAVIRRLRQEGLKLVTLQP
jgi:peptidoglycan/xylan/chitin deacetylase (PgdA/CDA1 family)